MHVLRKLTTINLPIAATRDIGNGNINAAIKPITMSHPLQRI